MVRVSARSWRARRPGGRTTAPSPCAVVARDVCVLALYSSPPRRPRSPPGRARAPHPIIAAVSRARPPSAGAAREEEGRVCGGKQGARASSLHARPLTIVLRAGRAGAKSKGDQQSIPSAVPLLTNGRQRPRNVPRVRRRCWGRAEAEEEGLRSLSALSLGRSFCCVLETRQLMNEGGGGEGGMIQKNGRRGCDCVACAGRSGEEEAQGTLCSLVPFPRLLFLAPRKQHGPPQNLVSHSNYYPRASSSIEKGARSRFLNTR